MTIEHKEHSFQKVHLPLFLVQLCFASLPIYSKITFQAFGPGILAFTRIWGTAIIFSSVFFLFQREKIKDKKHLIHFAVLAFFGATGNIFFYLKGLQLSTAINASIIISSIPIFTLLVAVILKHEGFSLAKFIGVIVAFSGVCILIDVGNIQMGDYLKGNLMIILNCMLYSVYLVLMKPYFKLYKPFTIITYVFIFASIEIIPFTYSEVMNFNYFTVPAESYFPLGMVLIVGTFFPYLLNSLALKHAPSSFVAIYIYLQPVLAAIMAVLILGEVVTTKVVISALLIICGVTIVRFPRILLLKLINR
jgi:drug/metabolite transporter (DMT)-like permease